VALGAGTGEDPVILRPVPLAVNVAGVRESMRQVRRWVTWRYELRDERWTKVPCRPSGQRAKVNDPATWSTFLEAVAAYRAGGFDGIGFVLGDGWSGIDLDKCRRPDTCDVLRAATAILDATLAYREVSPSGTGVKLFGRADRIGFEVRYDTGKIVAFGGARFFAVTGLGFGDPAEDLGPLIEKWATVPQVAPVGGGNRPGYSLAAETSDDDLLLQAVGSDNGEKCLRLWRGDISGYASRSEADLALCCMLAFWTNGDAERVDRLFRLSGLHRAKWDTFSYRRATLEKALA
jgi:putative DNA primase/helicase